MRTRPRVGFASNPAYLRCDFAQATLLLKILCCPLGSSSSRSCSVRPNWAARRSARNPSFRTPGSGDSIVRRASRRKRSAACRSGWSRASRQTRSARPRSRCRYTGGSSPIPTGPQSVTRASSCTTATRTGVALPPSRCFHNVRMTDGCRSSGAVTASTSGGVFPLPSASPRSWNPLTEGSWTGRRGRPARNAGVELIVCHPGRSGGPSIVGRDLGEGMLCVDRLQEPEDTKVYSPDCRQASIFSASHLTDYNHWL